jgi:integrase
MIYKFPLSRERSRHGKMKIYVREYETDACGRRLRLRQRHPMPDGLAEGTPAFIAAYQAICLKIAGGTAPAAERRAATKPEGLEKITDPRDSLDWLIKHYLASKIGEVSKSTYYRLERSLVALRDARTDQGLPRGICRFDTLKRGHIEDLQKKWARESGPREAEQRVDQVQWMYNWAIRRELVTYNPARGVPGLAQLSAGKDKKGTHAWTNAEVAAWRQRFALGTEGRTALELGVLGGLRRSDIVRVGPDNIERDGDDWYLCWTEHKNHTRKPKRRRQLIFHELREALETRERTAPDCRYWVDLDRRPDWEKLNHLYIENLAAAAFLDWRSAVRLPGDKRLPAKCTMHGWRAAGAVRLALMHWTTFQIMGWGGWSNPRQVEVYTRDLNREEYANDGVRRYNERARKPRLQMMSGGRR